MKYFNIDFLNLNSDNTEILTGFKTILQTTQYTCAPTSLLMVLNYYNDFSQTEKSLSVIMNTKPNTGTEFTDLVNSIKKLGYETFSSMDAKRTDDLCFTQYHSFRNFVTDSLKKGEPIIVDSTDYGGHYEVIIGIDKKDNPEEDILIFADPAQKSTDITGYNYMPADRFFYMWFDHGYTFKEYKEQPFVILKRKPNQKFEKIHHDRAIDPIYFYHYDFFDLKNKPESLTLIDKFKTFQQKTEYTCGPACAKMVLKYYGEDFSEEELSVICKTEGYPYGTKLTDLVNCFTKLGYHTKSSIDYKKDSSGKYFSDYKSFKNFVLSNLKNKIPVIVENIDYGGHYKVIIGIDIKENYCDDIIIFADPYDKNDGKTDGYNYFYAERFYNMWFDEHCLEDNLKIQPFIAVYGKNSKK